MVVACAACSRSSNVTQRVALLPFENLTGDATQDWIATAGPKIVADELLGGAARAVPVQVGALRDAYAASASRLVHGYFEKRNQSFHFEFAIEDARTHKTVQTMTGDGDLLPALEQLARQIDAAAHPFSSANPQAVAAWAHGQYESAVSLDPDFGAAWLSWVQAHAGPADKQQATEIAARALQQPALRSGVDRAQLELVSASLRQDEPAQERALTALAGLMPHDSTVLRQVAGREMNARHYSEAVRYYQAVIQEEPDDTDSWNMLGYAHAFAGDPDSAQKSLEHYGSEPAFAANALDSQGEAAFLNGRFAQAEKYFLQAHAKNAGMLNGVDLLKAAYSRWLQGDLPGADQIFARFLAYRAQTKDALIPWRNAVWEYSTGRQPAAVARLSSLAGPAANAALIQIAQTQLAVWKDPSKLPQDLAALQQAYRRTPPAVDGITRVLLAASLVKAGQKEEARKLLVLWPLPGAEGDPLLQSFLFPKYLELKQELK